MTKNQIEYNRLLETKRSNQANEELTRIRDERAHSLGKATLAETSRYHSADIGVRQASLDEQIRSNKVRESETVRSNLAKEAETYRSNVAKEMENYRSNVAREKETARSNRASEYNKARQLALDTEIRRGQLTETIRSNKAHEAINWANVDVGYQNVALGRSQLTETMRRNQVQESQEASRIAEQHRMNTLTANQKARELAIRQQSADVAAYDSESRRIQAETQRSTARSERVRNYSSAVSSVVPIIGGAVLGG